MRRPSAIACLALGAVLLAAGCGKQEASAPSACFAGTGAYLRALQATPGQVRLSDGTAIGDCLTVNQQGGELASVGEAMVGAATRLNAEARAEAAGEAALRLGYLVGAAQHGADRTEGIHSDLIRRLTVAARFSPADDPLSAAFLAAYRRGFDAGHARG